MVYDPKDYVFVRHVKVEDATGFAKLIGAFEDGWLMFMGTGPFMRVNDGLTENGNDLYEVAKVSLDGSYVSNVFAEIRGHDSVFSVEDDGTIHLNAVPFGRTATLAMGPGNSVYYGWNDSIRIEVRSEDGAVQGIITYEHEPVPITNAEMDAEKPEAGSVFAKNLATREPYKTKPAYDTFVVDNTGNVWIRLSSAKGALNANWLVLDRKSNAVGMASIPAVVSLKLIRDNRAYGVMQEDGGAPMVLVYEIKEMPSHH